MWQAIMNILWDTLKSRRTLVAITCATTGLALLYYKYKQYRQRKHLKIVNDLFEFPKGIDYLKSRNEPIDLTKYTIFSENDPDRMMVLNKLKKDEIFIDETFDRAMGSFLGNIIGDALGAPFEFDFLRYGTTDMKNGFADVALWKNGKFNRFLLKPGQWTDDGSMALCLADSLLVKGKFDPLDLRLRFLLWWQCGYCNAFGHDDERPFKGSVGLGGNIKLSMIEFEAEKSEYTKAGDKYTSGNGSIMRNAAIPIFYFKNPQEALDKAVKQSKTTHQGDEAAECCKLLTHIVIRALNLGKSASVETVLSDPELGHYESPCYSIRCLACSKAEERHEENEAHNLEDRNWNWKNSEFKYSPDRSKKMPGYIGSYSMDCLAMALHCVNSTNNFVDALLMCANLRGDSDTVCAVTGQIAGAIYGLQGIPKDWINAILKWDPKGYIPLRAYKLYVKGLNA